MEIVRKILEETYLKEVAAWLRLDPNWLLIVPWAVIILAVTYRLVPALKEIKPLRRFVEHWLTFVGLGLFIGAIGVAHGLLVPTLVHFLLGALPSVLIGAAFVVVGLHRRPKPLPKDHIVISVAGFTSVSEAAQEDAKNVRHELIKELGKRSAENGQISVRRDDSVAITGANEEEMRSAAEDALKGKAHIIIWGEVQRQEATPYVTAWMRTIAQPSGVNMREKDRRDYPPAFEPEVITFRKRVGEDLADLAIMAYGLALYELEQWDRAKGFFGQVSSHEGRLYEGLCWYGMAALSRNPRPCLEEALKAYQKAAPPEGWLEAPELGEDQQYILGNIGAALSELGLICDGAECRFLLEESVTHYRRALREFPEDRRPQDWATTQNNLGNVLCDRGERVEG